MLDTVEHYEATSGDDSPMRLNGSSASSVSVASRLYGQRGSRRGSFGSDADASPELISFSDSEQQNDINYLSTQVSSLTKKLTDMEETRNASNDERARLRMENAVLNERIHVLEEQNMNIEQRYQEKLEEERSRHKDLLVRLEREKTLEIESCQLKYQVLERDLASQKNENSKLQNEVKRLNDVADNLRDQLSESNMLCEGLEEERKKIDREFKKYKEEAQQDIDSSSELVEELSRQTHELRSSFPRQGSMADHLTATECEVERLRKECRELREQNNELHAQLLHDSVERGRSLLDDAGPSLLDELGDNKDSTELLNALREQDICNQKLRVYINNILMRVIELHPEMLEINMSAPPAPDSGHGS